MYEIGSSPFFAAITPGLVTDLPEEEEDATEAPSEQKELDFTTYKPRVVTEDNKEFPTDIPTESQPSYPESGTITPGPATTEDKEPYYEEPGKFEPEYPGKERAQPRYPEPSEPRYPDYTKTGYTVPETTEPRHSPNEPRYPKPDPAEPRYTNPDPVQPVPPYSRPHQPQIVVVDEDENLDVNGKITTA